VGGGRVVWQPMRIDVAMLPSLYDPVTGKDRMVVVFDVLRATTTIAAALAAGIGEIRVFDDLEAARRAAEQFTGEKLLCGESRCIKPEGFDAGNSPAEYTPRWAGRSMFMATTNGTRAIVAAGRPGRLLTGALINASAVAGEAWREGRDVVLLCAGTDGRLAMEDVIGAGAVIEAMSALGQVALESDAARMARRMFAAARRDLPSALAEAQGGRNVTAAGLAGDVEFAARLDGVTVVGEVLCDPLRVVRVG
jgi:2-phosphosulfolactate phosphatase